MAIYDSFLKRNFLRFGMDGLLVGRFQPFHLGHLQALKFALSKVDKLWLGLGSSNKPIVKNDPFSAQERKEMILSSINNMKEKISIYFIPDLDNHIKWVEMIDEIVPKFQTVFSNDPLIDHLYSKRSVKVISIPFLNRSDLSGTNIRNLIISDQKWEHLVPQGTKNFLIQNNANDRLKNL